MAADRFDRAMLELLIERYEALRDREGMGSMLRRVSPMQYVDALQICIAAYASGRVPETGQRAFWLAYLRPVLADTRESAQILARVFDEVMPPDHTEQKEPGPKLPPLPPPQRKRWRPGAGLIAAVAAVLIGAGILVVAYRQTSAPVLRQAETSRLPPPSTGAVDPTATAPALSGGNQPDFSATYQRLLRFTLETTARFGNEITPYSLAAALAGEAPELGEPSLLLAEMLRSVPLDPLASIPRTPFGAIALRRYAALAASSLLGESIVSFEDLINHGDIPSSDRRYDPARLLREFQSGAGNAPRLALGGETWPPWLRVLPLLALLPGLAWAFWGRANRRRDAVATALRAARGTRAEFRRAEAGAWGRRSLLQSSKGLPPLPWASQPARRLMRMRETLPGSRLDVVRSVNASLAAGGEPVAVMRDGSRSVDIVFLVRRRHRHDHERARVLRLLDSLSRSGVSLTAYDYSPDPRSLTATSRTDATSGRAPQRTLDLRGLRELHGDPLLVIVSDGEDLVDRFSQRPHHFVRDQLRQWSRRMLLTPVPVAEWGEREMAIAAALNAPIGRATMAGLADLELGLQPDAVHAAPRRVLERALRSRTLAGRIGEWSTSAAMLVSPDDIPARPAMFEQLGSRLLQEVALSPALLAQLTAELKRWLGPGFFWFAACGIYPQLRVDLTLWLGARLHRYGYPENPIVFTEDLFNRLCLLPWFSACHMPNWLRMAAVAALSERERAMLRGVIDELVAGRRDQPEASVLGLEVWQADWRGQALTPDDVTLEFKSERKAVDTPAQEVAAAQRTATWSWLRRGALRAAMVAVWAGVACWLMPAFDKAPLPQGVWLPVMVYAAASLLMLAIIWVCDRAGLFALPIPKAVPPPSRSPQLTFAEPPWQTPRPIPQPDPAARDKSADAEVA